MADKLEKGKKIILYQGLILKGRGIDLIYNVLKELPDYIFVIIGGGDFENYYKELAAKMDLVDQVYFLGKLTQEELPKVTSAADVGLWIFDAATGDLIHNQQFDHRVLPPVVLGKETFVTGDLWLYSYQ